MLVGKERWLERIAPNLALDRQGLPRQLPHQPASPLALQTRQKITVRLNTGDKKGGCRRRSAGSLDLIGVRWHYHASAAATRAALLVRRAVGSSDCTAGVEQARKFLVPAQSCLLLSSPWSSQNATHTYLEPMVVLRA